MNKHPTLDRKIKAQKQRGASEYQIHCAIAEYLNRVIKRPSRWHTVEVSNQASGRAAMLRQMALKKRGVITGWCDIEVFWQRDYEATLFPNEDTLKVGGGLKMIFLEVKIPGAKLTEKQEILHKELREDGHHVKVVYSVTDVELFLKELGVV